MSWKPTPRPSIPPATVTCTEDGCTATTEVERAHADNLRTCWRCRKHYRGSTPTTRETR